MAETPSTIGERISSVTGKLKAIVATGNNQFDREKKALSVQDVEEALRPLLADDGVVINWSVTNAALIDGLKLWRLDFHVTVFAATDPADKIEADWMDVGNSPSAAASFAVKGYYRRLFHLADIEDQQQQPTPKLKRQIQETEGERGRSDAASRDASPSSLEADPEDFALLAGLASTLKKPWADLYLRQEIAAHGLDAVRRRLVLAHAEPRNCGRAACEHVAAAAGFLALAEARE